MVDQGTVEPESPGSNPAVGIYNLFWGRNNVEAVLKRHQGKLVITGMMLMTKYLVIK